MSINISNNNINSYQNNLIIWFKILLEFKNIATLIKKRMNKLIKGYEMLNTKQKLYNKWVITNLSH